MNDELQSHLADALYSNALEGIYSVAPDDVPLSEAQADAIRDEVRGLLIDAYPFTDVDAINRELSAALDDTGVSTLILR